MKMVKRGVIVILVLLAGGMTLSAQAASFDCSKATTKIERMICDNPELSKLDEDLGLVYGEALEKASDPAVLKNEQLQWLKERNACGDADCAGFSYKERIAYLGKLLAQAGGAWKPLPDEEGVCLEPKIDWRDYAWVLITGENRPACHDMLAYLQSRPSDAPPPVCPEDRLPPNKDWTRPEGRDLTEAERQILIDGLPDHLKEKNTKVGKSIEWQFKNAGLLRTLSADISRDGIPEYLLAYGMPYVNHDYRQECKRATRCASTRDTSKGFIGFGVGSSYHYELQPMNDEGTQVNWAHRTAGYLPMLMGGELIYYKGMPYWLSYPIWFQESSGSINHAWPITSPVRAMFKLNEIGVASLTREKAPNFDNVTKVAIEMDPESRDVCRFGYFHRENIKQNLFREGK